MFVESVFDFFLWCACLRSRPRCSHALWSQSTPHRQIVEQLLSFLHRLLNSVTFHLTDYRAAVEKASRDLPPATKRSLQVKRAAFNCLYILNNFSIILLREKSILGRTRSNAGGVWDQTSRGGRRGREG